MILTENILRIFSYGKVCAIVFNYLFSVNIYMHDHKKFLVALFSHDVRVGE
jgi:hypothetical protein